MSEDTPINWQKGFQYYNGDHDMFKLMVERFEALTFNPTLHRLYQHVMEMSYKDIKLDAYALNKVSA